MRCDISWESSASRRFSWNIMPYLLFLKKRQNLKLSSAAYYRWLFMGKLLPHPHMTLAVGGMLNTNKQCILWYFFLICRQDWYSTLHGTRSGEPGAIWQTCGCMGMWYSDVYSVMWISTLYGDKGTIVWSHCSGKISCEYKWLPMSSLWYRCQCIHLCVLSCQPRVTVTSCFVYKVIRDLLSIDHLYISPICRIGLIHKT